MNRRQLVAGLAAAGAMGSAWPAWGQGLGTPTLAMLANAWEGWKASHLASSGRVVDALQDDASHSEGQGYGLVLASLMGDEDTALTIFRWTEDNLAIRDDGLLAWRWFPDRSDPVPDRNNASDGDLFFGWGCLRAGRRFGRSDLINRAREIAASLTEHCLIPDPRSNGRLLFIPAVEGFERATSAIVNPSYAMPLAMNELGSVGDEARLLQASRDSVALLSDLASEGTTPDWIAIMEDGTAPDEVLSDRTGYEAIRMPLFLIWSGLEDHPMVLRHRAVAADANPQPGNVATVFERRSGVPIEWSADVGYHALAAMLGCGKPDGRSPFFPIPPFDGSQPYYPATLHMMALTAQILRYPSCVPL